MNREVGNDKCRVSCGRQSIRSCVLTYCSRKRGIRSSAERTSISASAVPATPPGLSGQEKVPSVSKADLVRVLILCSDSTEQAASSVCLSNSVRFEHFRVAVKAVVKNWTGSFLPFTVTG